MFWAKREPVVSTSPLILRVVPIPVLDSGVIVCVSISCDTNLEVLTIPALRLAIRAWLNCPNRLITEPSLDVR